MTRLVREYRRDHLANVVVPVGPPLMATVLAFFLLAQVVHLISMPEIAGWRAYASVAVTVALFGFIPLLRHYGLQRRPNATAAVAIIFLAVLSLDLSLAQHLQDVHWLMRLPYAGIYTMAATIFWTRKMHLVLGLAAGMAFPTGAAIVMTPSMTELVIRIEFALAIVVFSYAIYLLVHRVHQHNHRVARDAVYRARHDGLTGLVNRQHWMDLARAACTYATRTSTPLSLLYLDLDHFKETNDRFGHAAGDLQLKLVAQTLRQEMPKRAIIGRFGGEEFVVLLPDTGLNTAVAISHRINPALASVSAGGIVLTASIGIAEWLPAEPLDRLIARADRAMLQAKADGRCQTVVDGATPLRPQPSDAEMPSLRPVSAASFWFSTREQPGGQVSSG